MKPRAVMDTNVLHAAFYSRQGASFDLFNRLIADEWRAVVSNHLIHEYEEILKFKAAELNLRHLAPAAGLQIKLLKPAEFLAIVKAA